MRDANPLGARPGGGDGGPGASDGGAGGTDLDEVREREGESACWPALPPPPLAPPPPSQKTRTPAPLPFFLKVDDDDADGDDLLDDDDDDDVDDDDDGFDDDGSFGAGTGGMVSGSPDGSDWFDGAGGGEGARGSTPGGGEMSM